MSSSDSLEADDAGAVPAEDAPDHDIVTEPDAPQDPWTQEVLTQLDKLQDEKRSPAQSILVLIVTIVLFGAAEIVQQNVQNLAWLVGVLLIHESGHFAGMKLFGYRDVRMFFLPFFGAAVSGRSPNVAGWKEGVVILLGPVPGIAIGAVLGALAVAFKNESLRSTALLFACLNGFNLLPLMPLDGGRLLELTVFGRQRHLEALFQGTTGLLLALLGFSGGGWILGAAGLVMLIGSGHVLRISTLARQTLAAAGDGGQSLRECARIPQAVALQILERVREKIPHAKSAKTAALVVRQVWDRMQVNPPGLAATLALLAVYAVSFVGMLVVGVALVLAGMSRAAPPSHDKQMLAQPQLEFADGHTTQQGTAFFVRAPNGAVAAVTASHYLDQNGPALNHVRLLSVTGAEPTALADSAICWGSPGGEGVRGENDVTDLRVDRFLLPVSVDENLVHVLELDDRPGPEPGERVWFPDKQPGKPGGFRLLAGKVIQVETRFVCVELSNAMKIQSQSGSPVISRINGKVLGLLGGGTEEPGSTILFFNPAAEIRKALEDATRPELSTVVGKPAEAAP